MFLMRIDHYQYYFAFVYIVLLCFARVVVDPPNIPFDVFVSLICYCVCLDL